MSDRDDYLYPDQVALEIPQNDRTAYLLAAEYINRCDYQVLSVQHEYGIFGGNAGEYLLALLREVRLPIVTTLHTVLREPSDSQKTVMDELLQLSERVIVMSAKAVEILGEVHDLDREKIDLIPHGIPYVAEGIGGAFRAKLNIDGPLILTFGLLSPDKGIESVIEAMPRIVQECPGATYLIVGATHPHVRASSGESYREKLADLARELGVIENVRFVNRFVAIEELVEYLGAMDVYITPYLKPTQITSGTLAYAVGAGKPVISTPYWYAEELLAEGRGILVPFRDSTAIAEAVLSLQSDPDKRAEMGRKAAEFGNQMHWPQVAESYLSSFARARADSADRLRMLTERTAPARSLISLPALRFEHLLELSDDTGILQHATFTVPNRSEGYCVDDNARALLLTTLLEAESPLRPDLSVLQSRYLSFVIDAYNAETGRFRNFMSYQREWLESAGSEDSQGRSLWALGTVVNRCENRGRREVARAFFDRAAPKLLETSSPRTWAYAILGADEYLRTFPFEHSIQALKRTLAARLLRSFEANHSDDWPWFEQSLAYCNARLPQALVIAGEALESRDLLQAGLLSLEWLMAQQTSASGLFCPIGSSNAFVRGEVRPLFDQQPVEAAATVSACLSAYRVTGNPTWADQAQRAFGWFLGHNMLGQPVFDKTNGGCFDGLHPDRVNRNQGAESTLSFLCALSEVRRTLKPAVVIASPSSTHELI